MIVSPLTSRVVLFISLLTIVAHMRGLSGEFVEWDDNTHITQNPAIRSLSPAHVWTMFTVPAAKLYVPLTWLSFAVDYQIWERNPLGYHLTNLLLHLATTLLVFALVSALLRDRYAYGKAVAVLTAALFGVHPLHVESIAWATERKDLLFAFFYLLGLLAYLSWVTNRKCAAYWGTFACFVASALSKSTAVTFPLTLLLLDTFWRRRIALAEKIPFFAVCVIITLATFSAQAAGKGDTVVNAQIIPVWSRLGLTGFCSLFYVGKFFWPFHLSAVYPPFDEMGWTSLHVAGWLAAFAIVNAGIFALRHRAPALLPAWLFYLITLSPTIGLVPVGIHVVADRFSYLPLIGLAFIVSAGVVAVAQAQPRLRIIVFVIAGLALTGLAALSVRQTSVWADTETLFRHVLRENPDCLPAHVNLTFWYNQHKRYDDAIAHGRRAVELAPQGLPGRKNLAFALLNAEHPREAVEVLLVAVNHGVEDADVWRGLSEGFAAMGDEQNAMAAKNHWSRLTRPGG